jgi:hypothetical protein
MTNVTDVLGGKRTLLEVEDLVAFETTQENSANPNVVVFYAPTTNGGTGGPTSKIPIAGHSGNYLDTFATASGWMFNSSRQLIATFSLGSPATWQVVLTDLGVLQFPYLPVSIAIPFQPAAGNTPVPQSEQIIMGNFLGTGLDDPMLLYAEARPDGTWDWKARLISGVDPNQPFTDAANIKIGPEYVIVNTPPYLYFLPAIAQGDFSGKQFAHLAVFASDRASVSFIAADPTTLALSRATTVKVPQNINCSIYSHAGTSGITCPFALAAGRFRSNTHDDLTLIAQAYTNAGLRIPGPTGLTVYSLAMGLDSSSNLTGNLASTNFINAGQSTGDTTVKVIATVAPIEAWSANIDELVLVNDTSSGYGGHVYIGDFDQSLAFKLQSDTNVTDGHAGCVYSAAVGNFDTQGQNGAPSTDLSLVTYWVTNISDCNVNGANSEPQYRIYPIRITPVQPGQTSNWLSQGVTDAHGTSNVDNMLGATLLIGDMQGRSIHLGAPEKVTIQSHLQPDMVIGLPPMHVDWIDTIDKLPYEPGCGTPEPCLANLTVKPSSASGTPGFQSSFGFSSSSATSASDKSTTGWTFGLKFKASNKDTWGVPGEGQVSVSERLSADYSHTETVQKTYSNYHQQSFNLNAKTGFSDLLIYTTEVNNFYYYPVLGQNACLADNPDCSDSEKKPLYVMYSVPSKVQHITADASNQEWYQPIQEPGNIFSYPWTLAQLGDEYNATPLTSGSPTEQQIGTFSENYSSQWAQRTGTSSSYGWTNSWSLGGGFTVSGGAKLATAFSDNFSVSLDLSGGQNFASVNDSAQLMDASTGISVNNPGFDSRVGQCCSYGFSAYAMGMTPFTKPFDNLTQPADITGTGPLFLAFNADLGNNLWWKQAYVFPDVGLNHPGRWTWTPGSGGAPGTVNFNQREGLPEDDPFYQMKGFFITSAINQTAGGNLLGSTLSQAIAGDQLYLTTRVYNFSPVNTPENASIHVAVWDQEFDGTNLIGDGVFIKDQIVSGIIPGYQASSQPNWTLVSIPFDTTNYGGKQLVFWVLVYMVDPDGRLLPEMPGHGLSAVPDLQSFKQIKDIPTETYSNNVGLYGTYTHFNILPAGVGATPPAGGTVKIDDLTLPRRRILLDQRTKVVAELTTSGQAAGPVTLAYYDGDPGKNGEVFATQEISYIAAGQTEKTRVFYTPKSAGLHDLYLIASTSSASSKFGPIKVHVRAHAEDDKDDRSDTRHGDDDRWSGASELETERNATGSRASVRRQSARDPLTEQIGPPEPRQ